MDIKKILNRPKMGQNYTKKLTLKYQNVKKSSKPRLLGVLSTPRGPQSMLKQVLPVFEQYVKKPTFLGKKNIPFPKKIQMHAICRMRIAQKTITYQSTLLSLQMNRILFRINFTG